jgi:hypothetical protein
MKSRYVGLAVVLVAGLFLFAHSSASSAEVKGGNVKLVIYGRGGQVGGAFYQTGPKKWLEYNDDHRHEFQETSRDEWSVFLKNTKATSGGTGYEVRLDLHTHKVYQTLPGQKEKELYPVLKAYD